MTALQKPRNISHGRHQYLNFYYKGDVRLAGICKKAEADLQSCAIDNPNSRVLRYLMIDLDAKRANKSWKNEEDILDFDKIKDYLVKYYPEIFEGIEYATRSHGGKGIHLIFGFSAFPLNFDTEKIQGIARYSQNLLIKIFDDLEMGADFGAVGLCRYFSTFHKSENVLYHNQILKARIDSQHKLDNKSKTPFLTNLYGVAKSYAESLNLTRIYRIHTSVVVEKVFAKLYLHLMGQRKVDDYIIINKNLDTEIKRKFSKLQPYESITLTYEELNHVCGLSITSIKRNNIFENKYFLKLFNLEILDNNTINISASKDTEKETKKIIYRCKEVLYYIKKRGTCTPELILPEDVKEGNRNLATWSWALRYKLAGFSEEIAYEEIAKRLVNCRTSDEDIETSDEQIRCVVRSMYARLRHLIGQGDDPLPEFLMPDDCSFFIQSGCRRESMPLPPQADKDEITKDKTKGNKKVTKAEKEAIKNFNNTKKSAQKICKNINTGAMVSFLALCKHLNISENSKEKVVFAVGSYVRKDGFVYFDGKHYSLGLQYYGSIIRVFGYKEKIYIYQGENIIDTHDKFYHKYKKYVVKEHHKLGWDQIKKINAAQLYIANNVGIHCYNYIATYLEKCEGFSDTKFLGGVLSINKRAAFGGTTQHLDTACEIALERNAFSYRILNQIWRRLVQEYEENNS